jgi:hypothetical protein
MPQSATRKSDAPKPGTNMVWVDGAAVGAASSAIRDGLAALSAIIVAEFETRAARSRSSSRSGSRRPR